MTIKIPKVNILDKLLYKIFKLNRHLIIPKTIISRNPYITINAKKEGLISYLKRVIKD